MERVWSDYASTFDDEPDHGLRDPLVRQAWAACVQRWLPAAPQRVADLGCGTGSLSLLLAEHGHSVIGFDLAAAMATSARGKWSPARGDAAFAVADVGNPPLKSSSFDAVLCRHVLWALGDPERALRRWARLLRPGGRLVAIEGRWFEPEATATPGTPPWNGGVRAATLSAALEPLFQRIEHEPLSARTDLWGKAVDDERYVVVASDPR